MNVNYKYLPIKLHYFFFMAALGPILPFLPVYGKQLGVSPIVMGSVTSVLPILFLLAKPTFGFIVDYFREWRKTIFISLLMITSTSFILMNFLPTLPAPHLLNNEFHNVSFSRILPCLSANNVSSNDCSEGKETTCRWICENGRNFTIKMFFNTISLKAELSENASCILKSEDNQMSEPNIVCKTVCEDFPINCLYTSSTFLGFIALLSIGNIGFNVGNSVTDAICFDVLGKGQEMKYGKQRVWGTIGFGISAFMAGYLIDLWSSDNDIKSYTPAFILVLIFSTIDLIISIMKLKLPDISRTESIVKDVYHLIRMKPIAIFLCFSAIAGILDSFIIYFLFWYLEDLASVTGFLHHIKLIQGLVVAAETLGGEVIFFSLSGKILKRFGYGYTLTFCFASYAIRLGLISLVPNPWWSVVVEFFMQGPSYALCYTSIVAFASAIAPPGTSATVQGIVAGMDDGFGYAIGSLLGGILYKNVGGVITLRIFSILAVLTSVFYYIFYVSYLREAIPKTDTQEKCAHPESIEETTCAEIDS